ncbi:hypothetical protein B0H13DRAFT_1968365, partial [Mycena leptocephala]
MSVLILSCTLTIVIKDTPCFIPAQFIFVELETYTVRWECLVDRVLRLAFDNARTTESLIYIRSTECHAYFSADSRP